VTTALPTQVTYGTFKGKLIDAINTGGGEASRAVTGTVTASPAVNSVNIPAALVVMLPRPVTVTLDANGAFTMQLVATDDPALSIINWAYQISFQLGNGDALAPFLVQLPGGSTVDLSTANPVSTGGGVAITQGPAGPAGPTALFDADAVPYLNATAPAPAGPGVQPANRRLVTEASGIYAPRVGPVLTSASMVAVSVIVKGMPSQTGDLLQLQSSSGSVLTKIDNTGAVILGGNAIYARADGRGLGLSTMSGAPVPLLTMDAAYGRIYLNPAAESGFDPGSIDATLSVVSRPGVSGVSVVGHASVSSRGNGISSIISRLPGDINSVCVAAAQQTANISEWRASGGAVLAFVAAAGGFGFSPATAVASPPAGAAGALPAAPTGYAKVTINGTDRQVAYY